MFADNCKKSKASSFSFDYHNVGGEIMDWQTKMNKAVNYIEENLVSEIKSEVIAKMLGYSAWEFQRMFTFVTDTSLGEYIRNRRLANAAYDIQTSDEKIINIALKYGYDSAAAFTRAFNRYFGISPSSARDEGVKLKPYPKITFPTIKKEGRDFVKAQNNMQLYSERGYYIKENAPVYYTTDMDKTFSWFCDVLGWFGGIDSRNEDGVGEYGCVFDYPGELIASGLVPFRGIHLFNGEPSKGVVGFIMVQGLKKFRQFVLANGWNQITEINAQPWGVNECQITTVDGCILRFFE